MRILMVGAGATGGYYGGWMAHAGRDITFLVRGNRLRELQTTGIRISSHHGNPTIPVKTITAAELSSVAPFDLVLLSVKAYSLDSAIADLAGGVGPDTVIIPLLNGMRHLDVLAERFGKERLMGGSVRIVSDVEPDGRIVQMTELDEFTFGELNAERTPRAERIFQELDVPGYTLKLADDILAAMWQKWWILATMGAVCVVGGGTVGDMVAAGPWGVETARAITDECVAIATANGYPANAKALEGHYKRMTEPGSSLTSSMFRDMKKGLPVEVDHILGDLLERAQDAKTPLLKGAYVQLKTYERHRSA